MKIFVGMKVPRADEGLRLAADLLTATIKMAGHQPFVATDEIAVQGLTDPGRFMPFVLGHLCNASLVILLNHPDLRGGLVEAGMAYAWDIPIWLCHKPGERLSSSMRGCSAMTIEYETLDDLQNKLSSRLKGSSLMNCPECGAPEIACKTRFEEFLVLEFTDAGYGAVHHLMVSAYMLQHSSKLTREGWLHERKLLREFLVERKPPAYIRKQNKDLVDSGKRTFKIKSKDGKPVINKTAWAKTILDVQMENAETYCEDVIAWARSVLEESEKISGDLTGYLL